MAKIALITGRIIASFDFICAVQYMIYFISFHPRYSLLNQRHIIIIKGMRKRIIFEDKEELYTIQMSYYISFMMHKEKNKLPSFSQNPCKDLESFSRIPCNLFGFICHREGYYYRGQPKAGTGYKKIMLSVPFVFSVLFPGPRFPL